MSSLPADPYKALGVSKDAQIAEIRSAYKKLILKCHPDKIQDPELKEQKVDEFQKVQQAYELLSDEKERQKYDDQVKIAELRRQFASKANTSSPRTVSKYPEFEIRTAEPRAASFKPGVSMPVRSKTYHTYSRSWDDEPDRGPRIFQTEIRTSSRRETTYSDSKSSKRDREKEKERAGRKREDDESRQRDKIAEKQAKEVRRQEKRQREKARDKEIKREAEEKRKLGKPYNEPYDEDSSSAPKSEKKKSSSKKHDEKRERSSHREDVGSTLPPMAGQTGGNNKLDFAASYIEASRAKRAFPPSTAHHISRSDKPPAPTPPMPHGQESAYPLPDDEEVRRSSAKVRRGSSEVPRGVGREKSYRKSSRDQLNEGIYVVHSSSPKTRHASQFEGAPPLSSSPRSGALPRTQTMPSDYSRSIPVTPSRAQTFSYGEGTGSQPRGRERSRMHSQVHVEEDTDSDEEYDLQRRHAERSERKYKSSRRARSSSRSEHASRYAAADSRAAHAASYARHITTEPEVAGSYRYHPTGSSSNHRMDASRPPPSRGASYVSSSGGVKYGKVKESKNYSYDDVAYSNYPQQSYQQTREYPAAAYA